MRERPNNVLIAQSGGPTPVMNRSLFGIVREAARRPELGCVYGAVHGLDGVLSGSSLGPFRPLGSPPGGALPIPPARRWALPGAGSTEEDVPAALEALSARGIGYLFVIGGNDSAETGRRLGMGAREQGRDLTVTAVPKTIDNDLVETDHTPGYGSAARFVALATMGAGRDAEAMGQESPITLIEVMGRDSGWLAASAALAKREERDAPHALCLPEVPVDEERFLDVMECAYARFGFAVAVIAENARGVDGVIGGQEEPWYVDDFGHAYFEGPARYLAGLVSRRLGVRVRCEKPGTIQRSMTACVSETDAQEAEMVGRAAVRYALDGHGDCMVTLVREGAAQGTGRRGVLMHHRRGAPGARGREGQADARVSPEPLLVLRHGGVSRLRPAADRRSAAPIRKALLARRDGPRRRQRRVLKDVN